MPKASRGRGEGVKPGEGSVKILDFSLGNAIFGCILCAFEQNLNLQQL